MNERGMMEWSKKVSHEDMELKVVEWESLSPDCGVSYEREVVGGMRTGDTLLRFLLGGSRIIKYYRYGKMPWSRSYPE